MQDQTIFELYTNDRKRKYSSSPKGILKSAKKNYEKLYTKQTSSPATTEFLIQIPKRKKYLINTLIFASLKYLQMKS